MIVKIMPKNAFAEGDCRSSVKHDTHPKDSLDSAPGAVAARHDGNHLRSLEVRLGRHLQARGRHVSLVLAFLWM